MKTSILAFSFLLLITTKSKAAPIIFSWGAEKIIKVAIFFGTDEFLWSPNSYDPNTGIPKIASFEGCAYVDAGVRYKQFTLLFLPFWNYDETWCSYIQKDDKYLKYNFNELSPIASQTHVTLQNNSEKYISFWDKYRGKIIAILIVGVNELAKQKAK